MTTETPARDEAIRRVLRHGHTIDITTTGRKSGEPRRIEIVFHSFDGRLYIRGMPSGKTRAWLHNLRADPRLTFHLKQLVQADLPATAREITDEAERREVLAKVARVWKRDAEPMVKLSPLIEVTIEGYERRLTTRAPGARSVDALTPATGAVDGPSGAVDHGRDAHLFCTNVPAVSDLATLVRVSRLYYELGETQEAIAALVGVTRPQVSRLLKEARAQGVVEIRIVDRAEVESPAGPALRERFGLRAVHLAPSLDGPPELTRRRVGRLAGQVLGGAIRDGMVIGIGDGAAVSAVADELVPGASDIDATAVPLCGGFWRPGARRGAVPARGRGARRDGARAARARPAR